MIQRDLVPCAVDVVVHVVRESAAADVHGGADRVVAETDAVSAEAVPVHIETRVQDHLNPVAAVVPEDGVLDRDVCVAQSYCGGDAVGADRISAEENAVGDVDGHVIAALGTTAVVVLGCRRSRRSRFHDGVTIESDRPAAGVGGLVRLERIEFDHLFTIPGRTGNRPSRARPHSRRLPDQVFPRAIGVLSRCTPPPYV